MEDCIFCKIIRGEIPSFKLYEDDLVFAFLDINPVTKGHTLIIPKKHAADIFELDKEYLERIIIMAKKIGEKTKAELGAEGINLYHASGVAAEQSVFHFHLHVIPRKSDDGLCLNCAMTAKNVPISEFEEISNRLKIENE